MLVIEYFEGGQFVFEHFAFVFCYLVDPASSHTLNSQIKPCMSQYSLEKVKPQTAHEIRDNFLALELLKWITVVNLELIHATGLVRKSKSHLIRPRL